MKNLFKKAVSLTIALSTVAAMSVSAFATPAATYDPTDDSVTVTGYTTAGPGQYAVAVVKDDFAGSGTEEDNAKIYYVNQAAETGDVNISTILADMLLKGELTPGNYEVRIGTNATIDEGEQAYTCIDLVVEAPSTGDEKDYFTETVAGKVTVTSKTINTDAKAKWWTSAADTEDAKVFAKTSHKVKIVLDATAYPTADSSTYNVKVVDNDGNAVTNAEVYYSEALGFYVALVPQAAVTAGYKFEVEKAANTATTLGAFGEVTASSKVNLQDATRIAAIINKKIDNTLTTNELVIAADVTHDGQVNLQDATQIAAKVNKKITAYNIEQ